MIEARWFALVDRLAAAECRRQGLKPQDAEEFRADARLRTAERGEQILASHDGRSRIETYLLVIVARWLRDWQRAEWGKWRPSAEAVRLGPVAVALEQALGRDGETFERTCIVLRERFGPRASREELDRMRTRLPARVSRRPVPLGDPDTVPAAEGRADDSIVEREGAELLRRVAPAVRAALRGLRATDRLLLVLVFRDGCSVRAAARAAGLEHKSAGRRIDRSLAALRTAMESEGIDRAEVLLLLQTPIEGWLNEIDGEVRDIPPSRPSSQGAES